MDALVRKYSNLKATTDSSLIAASLKNPVYEVKSLEEFDLVLKKLSEVTASITFTPLPKTKEEKAAARVPQQESFSTTHAWNESWQVGVVAGTFATVYYTIQHYAIFQYHTTGSGSSRQNIFDGVTNVSSSGQNMNMTVQMGASSSLTTVCSYTQGGAVGSVAGVGLASVSYYGHVNLTQSFRISGSPNSTYTSSGSTGHVFNRIVSGYELPFAYTPPD